MRKENGTKRTPKVNIPRVKVTKTKEVWIPTKRRTQPDKELHWHSQAPATYAQLGVCSYYFSLPANPKI